MRKIGYSRAVLSPCCIAARNPSLCEHLTLGNFDNAGGCLTAEVSFVGRKGLSFSTYAGFAEAVVLGRAGLKVPKKSCSDQNGSIASERR